MRCNPHASHLLCGPGASCLTSLCLGFFICSMVMIKLYACLRVIGSLSELICIKHRAGA